MSTFSPQDEIALPVNLGFEPGNTVILNGARYKVTSAMTLRHLDRAETVSVQKPVPQKMTWKGISRNGR